MHEIFTYMKTQELKDAIIQLKKEKNALILAHNYVIQDLYDVADLIGDSLDLSRKAAKTDAEIIVFCGVHFMAESAKMLSPEKKVLLPDLQAGCFMADMVTVEKLREKKKEHPNAKVVCYVNSSAAVKAESDICCTSANAVKVVNSLDAEKIIFVPDQHLAEYVQKFTDKRIITWPGYCIVHHQLLPEKVIEAQKNHPDAVLIVHPESRSEVVDLADHVVSTNGMLDVVANSDAKEFLIATEEGMLERLRREHPDRKFYALMGVCINMKKITLQNTYETLLEEKNEIFVDEEIAEKAKLTLERMLKVS